MTKTTSPKARAKSILHHARTVWLFTRSDLKTIVIPSTLCALVFALSGQSFESSTAPSTLSLAGMLPRTLFWTWINLLPFSIQNQRHEQSIIEDILNKPWRPLPSKRLTIQTANQLMRLFYAIAVLVSLTLGGGIQCLTLIGLGYWYNEVGGADVNWFVRNFINACGYICFTSGASEVISRQPLAHFTRAGLVWFVILGFVVFTTIQAQDMADQAGDSLRGRKTAPLVIGDSAARWTIVSAMILWSFFCPAFWHNDSKGFLLPIVLGFITSGRFLLRQNAASDEISFRIYNAWIISLFACPLSRGQGII